ncbi:hypothetical protein Tco_0980402 [Tanacetum coccineum]
MGDGAACGDVMEPTSVLVKWLPFTNRNSDEAQTSDHAIIVDETGNPLKKVEYPNDLDSEDEVASVGNDMARSMASERVGFGTQSLLEQLRDSYGNGDYDEDPYDDDMYEGQDLPAGDIQTMHLIWFFPKFEGR